MHCSACLILPDGQVHELHGSCTLGRHASNDIPLQNDHISRQHALIQWQQGKQDPSEGGFLLVDLGSSNGSYVNGNRVSKPVALKNGDMLDLAGSRIEFRAEPGQFDTPTYGTGPTETIYEVKKRKLWLMVADIVGSTRMAQVLSPEDVPRVNGSWFKSCRELVESHGGHMNQYLGDGFFCYWEDTLEAQQYLPELLHRFSDLQAQATPPFRVVLHFGLTVLGSVPTLTSLNLHGPSVNFVFRMEKLAGSLGEPILLSEEAAKVLALPARTRHQAELTGYDGIHSFVGPGFGG